MASLIHQFDEGFAKRALETGDVDVIGEPGVTPLWHAVYFGRVELVRALLAAGARVDAHDPARIDRAAGDGHVVSIWQGVAEPGYAAPTGESTLLHVAVSRVGSPEILKLLLDSGLPVDARDRFGDTPLHVAAFAKAPIEAFELLLARGADPNAIDRAGYAPIDHAMSDLERVELLLAKGADPNGGPKTAWHGKSYEWSVVTGAAAWGRVDVLRALFSAGADPTRHREALPLAAKHGQVGAVRELLARGAPLDGTTDWRGRERRPLPSAAMYASLECVELLYPSCEDQRDDALSTAVELSADDFPEPPNDRRAERIEVVKWLLDHGADPSAAIRAAAAAQDEIYFTLLLERGARLDDLDESAESLLLVAARLGRHRAARLLLERGADPHARAADGKTAYETAEYAYRQLDIDDARLVMNLLRDAGAGPPPAPKPAPPPKTGPSAGDRVTHAKFGAGTITAVDGEKLTITFDGAGSKTLLAKFVTLT